MRAVVAPNSLSVPEGRLSALPRTICFLYINPILSLLFAAYFAFWWIIPLYRAAPAMPAFGVLALTATFFVGVGLWSNYHALANVAFAMAHEGSVTLRYLLTTREIDVSQILGAEVACLPWGSLATSGIRLRYRSAEDTTATCHIFPRKPPYLHELTEAFQKLADENSPQAETA